MAEPLPTMVASLYQIISKKYQNHRHKRQHQCVIACAIGIIDQRAPAVDTLNGLSGWVQSVVVSPQWQGNGLAIRLMHNLIFWFNEKDVRTIYLQTTPLAESLYRHLDFEDSGEKLLIKHLEN